ncbi:hypothetical protein SNL152K_9104 [Streptomyces sp. NL15-2K]|nr:hypothetical protein SNL152K_9104 [Streptomyces sp. NL15-2K]
MVEVEAGGRRLRGERPAAVRLRVPRVVGDRAGRPGQAGGDQRTARRLPRRPEAPEGADRPLRSPRLRHPAHGGGGRPAVSDETVVIDTSNYYPGMLSEPIEAVDNGQVESVYTAELLGRPVVKAWNAALAETQRTKGVPAGTPGRLAIPVAGDFEEARKVAMSLVDDTGFDAYDAGTLADSWRQQPNSPAYCTELTLDELPAALAAADRVKDAAIRDSVPERLATLPATATLEDVVEMNRAAHR